MVFLGGLGFFGYRMYMGNRVTLFDLPDQLRVTLYASATALIFALVPTRKFWDDLGPQSATIVLWFALISAAAYGFSIVIRRWREY
ncbi:MAG: hypothetical protein WKF94_07145 [Solirubrobacteraceae bacterium]